MASRTVDDGSGNALVGVEDVTYKAGSEELLRKNLDQKFGQEPMELVWHHIEPVKPVTKVDKNGKPVVDKNGQPVQLKMDARLRQQQIDDRIRNIVNQNKENNKSDKDKSPSNEKAAKLPIVCGLTWHDDKYAYVQICMESGLWQMFSSTLGRVKRGFTNALKGLADKNNVKNIAKNVTGNIPTGSQIAGAATINMANNWLNGIAATTNQRRQWREEKKRAEQQMKDDIRRANDPLQARLGFERRVRTSAGPVRSGPSSSSSRERFSWAHTYIGRNIDEINQAIHNEIGISINGKKINNQQLTLFNNTVYNNEEEFAAAWKKWVRSHPVDDPYFCVSVYRRNSGKLEGIIHTDPITARQLEHYIRTVRESLKITLTIGQLRRLINECRQSIG